MGENIAWDLGAILPCASINMIPLLHRERFGVGGYGLVFGRYTAEDTQRHEMIVCVGFLREDDSHLWEHLYKTALWSRNHKFEPFDNILGPFGFTL
ncbi:hypothetical protein VTI28DRAFT_4828 [Corynascus sepedonium]